MSTTTRALIGGTFALSALLAVAAVLTTVGGALDGAQATLALGVAVVSGVLAAVNLGGDQFDVL